MPEVQIQSTPCYYARKGVEASPREASFASWKVFLHLQHLYPPKGFYLSLSKSAALPDPQFCRCIFACLSIPLFSYVHRTDRSNSAREKWASYFPADRLQKNNFTSKGVSRFCFSLVWHLPIFAKHFLFLCPSSWGTKDQMKYLYDEEPTNQPLESAVCSLLVCIWWGMVFLLGAFGWDALEIRQEGKPLRRAEMTWVKIRKQLLKRGKPNHLYLIQLSAADFSEI